MRDPKRIDAMLEVLRAIWTRHPDLRLGQIIMIAGEKSVFYCPDDEMLESLKKFDPTGILEALKDFEVKG